MKAVIVTGFGGVDRLALAEFPEPSPGAGEVVIRVSAAALNPLDWKMAEGGFRLVFRQKPPYVPGFDIAGAVESVGSGAGQVFRPGERVVASTKRGGGLAELAAVDAASVARVSDRVPWEEAAAIPGAGCTALQALRDVARIPSAARVLVNGASGGVGTFAVQIARALGADVDATTSARNLEFIRGLGARRAYDYAKEDFASEAAVYDVVFDAVGTRSFGECRRSLKPGGAYVTTLPGGGVYWDIARTKLLPFAFGGRRAGAVMVHPNARDVAEILRWLDEGKVRPIVDRVAPMEIAAIREAFEHLKSGRARGKIVVRVGAAQRGN